MKTISTRVISTLWVGLVMQENTDSGSSAFIWEDGTTVDYTAWVPGHPTFPMDDYLIKVIMAYIKLL